MLAFCIALFQERRVTRTLPPIIPHLFSLPILV